MNPSEDIINMELCFDDNQQAWYGIINSEHFSQIRKLREIYLEDGCQFNFYLLNEYRSGLARIGKEDVLDGISNDILR